MEKNSRILFKKNTKQQQKIYMIVRVFLLLYSRAPTTYLVEMVEMMVREETRRLRGGAFV